MQAIQGGSSTLDKSRAYLDCCTLKDNATSTVFRKTWRIIVLHPSQYKISDMFPSKSAMVEPTVVKLNKLHQMGKCPAYLRMDNAGENLMLKQRIESKDFALPIKVEFTPRDAPQMNSPAEVAFATLGGQARAMMTGANVPFAHDKSLMPEACKHATMLDGLVVIKLGDATATRYEHQFGKIPPFAKHLHTWGEAGVVTIKARHMHPKHASRGVTCLYVGHSPDHPSDTFRMVDMATGRVHITRDVTWLHRMFFPKLKAGEQRQ
jgi:hypothetical protein